MRLVNPMSRCSTPTIFRNVRFGSAAEITHAERIVKPFKRKLRAELKSTLDERTFGLDVSNWRIWLGENLFDGGAICNSINVEDARTEEALVIYEQTVLFALEDVENSMIAYIEEQVATRRN